MNIKELVEVCHKQACEKGFWDNSENFNISEKLMLMVSELAEANEALRMGKTQKIIAIKNCKKEDKKYFRFTKVKEFKKWEKDCFEDELADTVIRIADLCGKMGIDLEWQIEHKLTYNKEREYKHGKQF